jgi:hypothetical protein
MISALLSIILDNILMETFVTAFYSLNTFLTVLQIWQFCSQKMPKYIHAENNGLSGATQKFQYSKVC